MFKQFFLASVILFALSQAAFAQDAQRLAPKTLPPNPPATLPRSTPTTRPSGNSVIVSKLVGIVFVETQNQLKPESTAKGLDFSQTPLLDTPKFKEQISPYLDRPLTLHQLNEICQLVIKYYREIDRPVVDAIVPQQDVTAGTVQILVLQGRLGKVTAEGNHFFSSERLTSAIRTKSGDVISSDQLLGDVDWLNRNPFRHTDLVLQPGDQLGQTDVVLQTEDHLPFRLYADYENTGTPSTGADRYIAGFNWGNAFNLDDQLNYQFTTNSDINRFEAHSGSYVMPLPWRHILTVFGNWSTSDVSTSPGVEQLGQSWQVSARYEIPLVKMFGASTSIVIGGDFKRSNTNADFGGTSVFNSNANVVQMMLGYDLTRPDSLGSTDATLEWYGSPGGVGPDNDRQAYDAARAGADPEYMYVRLTVDRNTNLPGQMAWVTRFQGQYATSPLLGSEQLGIGGMDSVRGYEEREGNGDDGIIFSNELHAPPINFLAFAGIHDQLTFLAFVDYGIAWDRDVQPGQLGRENFLGVGPGVTYRLGPWLSFDYYYGYRIADGDPSITGHGRNHLRVMASFSY